MELGLVGSGPALDALVAACNDVDCAITRIEPSALGSDTESTPTTGAVVAPTGADVFSAASAAFDRWVAVEIGGVGGHPVDAVDAAVSLFAPDSGCYRCLRTRVAATREGRPEANPSGSRSEVRLAGAVAGAELIGLLSGDRNGGRLVEIPWQERTFLPVPGCDCADGSPD